MSWAIRRSSRPRATGARTGRWRVRGRQGAPAAASTRHGRRARRAIPQRALAARHRRARRPARRGARPLSRPEPRPGRRRGDAGPGRLRARPVLQRAAARPRRDRLSPRGVPRPRARCGRGAVRRFAAAMRLSREHLGVVRKLYFPQQKWLWHLDAIETYCRRGPVAAADIPEPGPAIARARRPAGAPGPLRALRRVRPPGRDGRRAEGRARRDSLRDADPRRPGDRPPVRRRRGLQRGGRADLRAVQARGGEGLPEQVPRRPAHEQRRGRRPRAAWRGSTPRSSRASRASSSENADFVEPTIGRFDREIQFYLCWLEHAARLRGRGLGFCYPQLSADDPSERSVGGFDLALAAEARRRGKAGGDQRLPPRRPGADHRGVRAEPGRQDHLRPHLRPAALPRQPRPARSRGPRRSSCSSTPSTPISSARRTSPTCAASSRTTSSASTTSSNAPPRAASSC